MRFCSALNSTKSQALSCDNIENVDTKFFAKVTDEKSTGEIVHWEKTQRDWEITQSGTATAYKCHRQFIFILADPRCVDCSKNIGWEDISLIYDKKQFS